MRSVEETTGSPEMLGGRVKTLHPAIHGGILATESDADRNDLRSYGIAPFDLVVVNLYPFRQTARAVDASEQDVVEQIRTAREQ